MKFLCYTVIALLVILQFSVSRPTIQEKEESLQACLKLKSKAPYLNLNCDNLLETTNKVDISSFFETEFEEQKDISNENIIFLSQHELRANTKKIKKTEEEKLFQLLNSLKAKKEETAFLAK